MNIHKVPSIPNLVRKSNEVPANIVVVFIEKIFRYKNDVNKNTHYLLMDFPTNVQYKINFSERTEFNIVEGKSMLEINNVDFEKGGIPREGHFYNLPDALIEDYNWNPDIPNSELLTNYVALSSEGTNRKISFEASLDYNQFIQDVEAVNETDLANCVDVLLEEVDSSKIDIYAYNVGQGNWNEILFNDEFLIVYDLGSSSHAVFLETYRSAILIQHRNVTINSIENHEYNFKKILIISHWDVDHYNGIFALPREVIESFEFCIVPNKIENDTTFRAFEKLLNSTTVYPIEMNKKGRGRGATSRLSEIYNTDVFKIYKGTKCSDRNKRGLLLSLHANNIDFIFPGDHYYNQLHEYVIPNCKKDELNLVVPHHGGHAGNHKLMNGWTNCTDSIISSGGRHGHPFQHVKNTIQAKFNSMHRTDGRGCNNCNNPTHGIIPPINCTSSDYHRRI